MGQWNAWAGKVGDRMVDFGTPLDGGVQVTPEGTSPSTREVACSTLIEADGWTTPSHLNMPGGCTIEVHEALPAPGM